MMKIATCQYQIERLPNWESYAKKIESLVTHAKKQDAQVLLLPEYAGVEIGGLQQTDEKLYAVIQPLLPRYLNLFKELAAKYQMYLQPGTILEEVAPQQYINRAYFFEPNGKVGYQDKLQLTEFEKNSQLIQRGKSQTIFETPLGKIGIAICYDSEFPEIVKYLVTNGAQLILVPSYTNSLSGYYRVSLSCRARALENQCYVAVSFVVGKVDLSEPVDNACGSAAIYSPVDVGFPDDGVLALGTMSKVEMIVSEIDFKKIAWVRENGQVRNFADSQSL